MSDRPRIRQFPAISNGNMTTTLYGTPSLITDLSMMSYSVSWTGSSPVGAISVQVSNDYALSATGAVLNVGTWNVIPLTVSGAQVTSIPLSGNSGEGFIDIDQLGGYAVQIVYTPTSGTGTLQALFNAKVA